MVIMLPCSNDPAQTFTTQLGDKKYIFNLRWNDRSQTWSLDMIDEATQTPLLLGVALVLGTDLLQPHNLSIGYLLVVDETGVGTDAGYDELGTRVNVYWVSPDETLPEGTILLT